MFELEYIRLNSTEPANLMTRPTKRMNSLPIGLQLGKDEPHQLTHYLLLIGLDEMTGVGD